MKPQALPSLGLALADAKDMYTEQAQLHSAALCLLPGVGGCAIDADVSTGPSTSTRVRGAVGPESRSLDGRHASLRDRFRTRPRLG